MPRAFLPKFSGNLAKSCEICRQKNYTLALLTADTSIGGDWAVTGFTKINVDIV
jgi:hypothetical protein